MKRIIPILFILISIFALTGCEVSSEYFTVSFETNGAVKNIANQVVKSGDKAVEPKDPVKESSVFKAWTLNGEAYDFTTPVTADITLKATYSKLYTVVYNYNNGSEKQIQTVVEGTTLTRPSDPVNAKSSGFDKWMKVYGGYDCDVVEYTFDSPVTSDLLLYAIYKDSCTVNFNSDGGTSIDMQVLSSGDKVVEPKSPTKENAVFKQWVKVSSDGTEATEAYDFSLPVTGSFTLKAVYDPVYTVKFNSVGGNTIPDQTINAGGKVIEPKNPDKESTRGFMWWTTAVDEYGYSEPYDFSTPVTSDLTLIAVYWPANLRVENYTAYDNEMSAKYDEVRYQHYLAKKLVKLGKLMNRSTNVEEVFDITDKTNNPLVISLFTYAKMNPDNVTFKDGTIVATSNASLTYEINVADCSIENNTTKIYTNSIDSSKYTIDISNLVLNVTFRYNTDWEETQEVTISAKGTVLKNSDDRYELHVKFVIDGKEYPVLHGSAILSPKESGSSEYDNVLCFSYDGFTSYIPNIEMW